MFVFRLEQQTFKEIFDYGRPDKYIVTSDEYEDDAKVENGSLVSTNQELTNIFWKDSLGFNGNGTKLVLSSKGQEISYYLEGTLQAGSRFAVVGSITDIGSTSDRNIEYYISQDYQVTRSPQTDVQEMKKAIANLNYTIEYEDKKVYVTPQYVVEYPNNTTEGKGVIKQKDGFHILTDKNGKMTVGALSTSSIQGSDYDISTYSFLNDDVLYRYYPSSYFGLYTMYDTQGIRDLNKLFPSDGNKQVYALGLNYENSDGPSIIIQSYFIHSDNTLLRKNIVLRNVGTTKLAAVEALVS